VARFFNRQDANEHKRVLQRFIPAAEFEIVFDSPDEGDQEIEINP
jgi:putative acetyltransferase